MTRYAPGGALGLLTLCLALVVGLVVAAPVGAQTGDLQQLDGSGTADDPYVVTNATELQAIDEDRDAHYVLGADVDASETGEWNGGDGFAPIGERHGAFEGVLDGNGHAIAGLVIDRPGQGHVGVFAVHNGTVRDLELRDVSVRGAYRTGALAGQNTGTMENVTVDGQVRGGDSAVGGIAGASHGTLVDSFASGTVSGGRNVGGVAGQASDTVGRTGTTADVSAVQNGGGLVGRSSGALVRASFAAGTVSADEEAGGLVGYQSPHDGQIVDSWSLADVAAGDFHAGGLVGRDEANSVRGSYAGGSVTGEATLAGLFGEGDATDGRALYWDTEATGQPNAIGSEGSVSSADVSAQGLATSRMTGPAAPTAMDALDFDGTWLPTDGYPVLRWELRDLSVGLAEDVLVVGEATDVSVSIGLVGDRSRAGTAVSSYESEGDDVAAVEDGIVTARAPGETAITATHGGLVDTTEVIVIAAEGVSTVDAELDSTQVAPGESVTVTGTFRNVDENETSHDAAFQVDGERVTTANVTVAGESEDTHTFEWTPEETGSYDPTVDGIDAGTLQVTDPAAEGSDGGSSGGSSGESGSSGGSTDGGSGDLPLVLAIGAILGMAVVAMLARRVR